MKASTSSWERVIRVALFAASLLVGIAPVSLAVDSAVYSKEGAVACVDCHDTPKVVAIADTAHADFDDPRTPAAQKQCQSCHGPSANHMKFPMQVANVHFGKKSGTTPEAQNQMCIECHGTAKEKAGWHASAHGHENIVCSTCHSIHDPDEIVPQKVAINGKCEQCHADLMKSAQSSTYTHAIGRTLGDQGELTCSGCHNPHGPLGSQRCLECHSQAPEVLAAQSEKARQYHEVATTRGTECVRCHKGISHPISPLEVEVGIAGGGEGSE